MENNSLASKFTPKQSFFLGIVAAISLFFIIGFFVLLTKISGGSNETQGSAVNNQPLAAVPARDDSAPPPTRDIQLAAITDKDWIKGKRDAKISVVEFSDTECPFCKRFHPTMQRLIEEYPNDVNWVYRHFPLTSLHPKAPKEAEAAECAGEIAGNAGFWKFIDRLFEVTPSNNGLLPEQLPQIAQDVGINRQKFVTCLDSGKYAQKVQSHYTDATRAGGNGTPYSVVVAGSQKIPVSGAVPYEQLKTIIDSLLR